MEYYTAPSTKALIDSLADEQQAMLRNARHKRNMLAERKKQMLPAGTGLAGVLARYQEEQEKPLEERYIHAVTVAHSIDLVITLLPAFARMYHFVRASLHDFTYKRVHGKHKEWEVVIWNDEFQMREY